MLTRTNILDGIWRVFDRLMVLKARDMSIPILWKSQCLDMTTATNIRWAHTTTLKATLAVFSEFVSLLSNSAQSHIWQYLSNAV